jgi:membrane associated rhomboid family serine protease
MFPYHDENVTQRRALVTMWIIALNVLAWLLVQGAGSAYALAASVCEWGLVAGEITGMAEPGSGVWLTEGLACVVDPGRQPWTVFTSMFMHGGWMHLLGNMWFLWLYGNNVEDSMRRSTFLLFYLLCGVAAAAAQVWSDPAAVVPMVGASGAISGVMGGYLVLFPRVRVYVLVPLGIIPFTFAMPAWATLLFWFGSQVVAGLTGLSAGVAIWAHVGGFIAGVLLVKLFAVRRRLQAHVHGTWRPAGPLRPWR